MNLSWPHGAISSCDSLSLAHPRSHTAATAHAALAATAPIRRRLPKPRPPPSHPYNLRSRCRNAVPINSCPLDLGDELPMVEVIVYCASFYFCYHETHDLLKIFEVMAFTCPSNQHTSKACGENESRGHLPHYSEMKYSKTGRYI